MAINKKRNKWQVRVRDEHGSWYSAKSFLRKTDAERYERELINIRESGQFDLNPRTRAMTVYDYFHIWFKECRTEVSNGWKSTQIQTFRDHINPYIGDSKLAQTRKRDIELLMNKLNEKGLAAQSRVHVYGLLRKMFEDAIHHFEIIKTNPVISKIKPKIPKRERSFLRHDDAWMLLSFTRTHWLGPAIWLSTLSALRPSEVQALKWNAVDLETQRIIIKSAYNRKEKRLQDHPKQSDWGTAPIPLPLSLYLKELKEKSCSDFVVTSTDGASMLNYDSYYKGLKLLCRELKLTQVTPHELRHTATEIYYRAGASNEDLRRLLNHTSSKVTETYIHRTEERLKSVSENISSPTPHLRAVIPG